MLVQLFINSRLLREDILKALVEAEHTEAIAKAKSMFQELKKNNSAVSANLKSLVFSVGVKTGDEEDWKWCYDKYTSTNIPSDRAMLIGSLGASNNVLVLQRYHLQI